MIVFVLASRVGYSSPFSSCNVPLAFGGQRFSLGQMHRDEHLLPAASFFRDKVGTEFGRALLLLSTISANAAVCSCSNYMTIPPFIRFG